jgi:hypothetical protein
MIHIPLKKFFHLMQYTHHYKYKYFFGICQVRYFYTSYLYTDIINEMRWKNFFAIDLKTRNIVSENNSILLILKLLLSEGKREEDIAIAADLKEDYVYLDCPEDKELLKVLEDEVEP